mmetsp:Transcript_2468/g.4504  ORF Transcript_2468/g.4504 Transcript_2468/m.4504 type:complete len:213 (+) Transcript_2468:96-734(+)
MPRRPRRNSGESKTPRGRSRSTLGDSWSIGLPRRRRARPRRTASMPRRPRSASPLRRRRRRLRLRRPRVLHLLRCLRRQQRPRWLWTPALARRRRSARLRSRRRRPSAAAAAPAAAPDGSTCLRRMTSPPPPLLLPPRTRTGTRGNDAAFHPALCALPPSPHAPTHWPHKQQLSLSALRHPAGGQLILPSHQSPTLFLILHSSPYEPLSRLR